jgi:hypothetical protein
VIEMVAWPMKVESAFALTPAAISDAKVWRQACGVDSLKQ